MAFELLLEQCPSTRAAHRLHAPEDGQLLGSFPNGLARPAEKQPGPTPSPNRLHPVKIELATSLSEIETLQNDWKQLFHRANHSGTPFQSYDWCRQWVRHFARPGRCEPFILTARIGGRLALVMPLTRETRKTGCRLTWLGDPVTQYGDILVDPAAGRDVIQDAWLALHALPGIDLIELTHIRSDAEILPALRHSKATITRTDTAYAADLKGHSDIHAYALATFSKRWRSTLNRCRKRLEKIGALRLEVVDNSAACGLASDMTIMMKRHWLSHRGLPSRAIQDPRTERFFHDLSTTADRSVTSRVMTLMCGNEAIASALTFVVGDRCYAHVIAYRPDYEKWSPGHVLNHMILAHCLSTGLSCYDFMGPDARFKRQWSNTAVVLEDVAVPLTLKGRMLLELKRAHVRARLKEIYPKIPKPLRKLAVNAHAMLIH